MKLLNVVKVVALLFALTAQSAMAEVGQMSSSDTTQGQINCRFRDIKSGVVINAARNLRQEEAREPQNAVIAQ